MALACAACAGAGVHVPAGIVGQWAVLSRRSCRRGVEVREGADVARRWRRGCD